MIRGVKYCFAIGMIFTLPSIYGCDKSITPEKQLDNWEKITDPVVPVLAFKNQVNVIYALGLSGTYLSLDQGTTWKLVATTGSENGTEIQTWKNDDVVVGGGHIFHSSDRGMHWRETADSIFNGIALDTSGVLYAITSCGGVKKSKEYGRNFNYCPTNLAERQPQSIAISEKNTIFVGTWKNGLFKSTNDGIAWETAGGGMVGTASTIQYIVCIGRYVYACDGDLQRMYRSDNEGKSWQEISPAKFLCKANGDTLLGAGSTFMYSVNYGESWIPVDKQLDAFNNIVVLSAGLTNDGYALLGTDRGILRSKKKFGALLTK